MENGITNDEANIIGRFIKQTKDLKIERKVKLQDIEIGDEIVYQQVTELSGQIDFTDTVRKINKRYCYVDNPFMISKQSPPLLRLLLSNVVRIIQ